MYRTLVASSRRVLSCCPRVAPTAVHNRLTSLSLEQLQQLSRHAQGTLSRRLYSSDNKKPPRGTGNEDEEGREEPWIPGMLMNCIRKALVWCIKSILSGSKNLIRILSYHTTERWMSIPPFFRVRGQIPRGIWGKAPTSALPVKEARHSRKWITTGELRWQGRPSQF